MMSFCAQLRAKTQAHIVKSNTEPQLNGLTPQSLGQSSESRISGISCTADGFVDGSKQSKASIHRLFE